MSTAKGQKRYYMTLSILRMKYKKHLARMLRIVVILTAGLKCRSQVTGQVTGYRPQVRSQVRLQATGHTKRQ